MRKYLGWGALCVWAGTLVYFLLIPHTQRNEWMDLGIVALSVAVIGMAMALYARALAQWRVLGLVFGIQLFTQLWFSQHWGLWSGAWHGLNAALMLMLVDSFFALLGIILLMLFLRDVSVWALGIVYVACPLGMVLVMSRYTTQPQLEARALPESLFVNLPACLIAFLAFFGSIAFVLNLARLLYRELARRPL